MDFIRWSVARCLFYPTLVWNLLLCRLNPKRRWWDRIDTHVIVGAIPFRADVPVLTGEAVRAVINTCEEFKGLPAEYEAAGIEQLHVPTIDFTSPKLQDVERAVRFIAKHVAQEHTVYIHCKAGRGRSATIALCWLIASRGTSPQEAQRILQERRPHVMRSLHTRPVVKLFAEKSKTDPVL
jgi:atypical dual specificity phosphatase